MLGLIQVSAWRSYLHKSGYLAYPKTPKDLCSLSGSALDESITKLEETGLENANLYIKASCQQTNINLPYVYVTPSERQKAEGVCRLEKSKVIDKVQEKISTIQDTSIKSLYSKEVKEMKTNTNKSKEDFVSLYYELKELKQCEATGGEV